MDAEIIRSYALSLLDTEECFPFDEVTLVFKTNGKVFLLIALDAYPLQFNVKCDPDEAIELRENYPEHILPGYHMNKKHWNTIVSDGRISADLIRKMIHESYALVSKKIKPKKKG
jgi:predicted DNA-binding protein (MmcQ/YjbR family)